MAWAATAELAAAVSNAGGLGIIGAGNAPAEVVVNEIKKAKTLTDKPFGVNIYFISPFVEEVIAGILEEKVAVVTTGAGNPGKYVQAFKDRGIKIFPWCLLWLWQKGWKKLGLTDLLQREWNVEDMLVI
jgi:enoyl-[acyl-carrier protein] reductase II